MSFLPASLYAFAPSFLPKPILGRMADVDFCGNSFPAQICRRIYFPKMLHMSRKVNLECTTKVGVVLRKTLKMHLWRKGCVHLIGANCSLDACFSKLLRKKEVGESGHMRSLQNGKYELSIERLLEMSCVLCSCCLLRALLVKNCRKSKSFGKCIATGGNNN